MAEEIVYRYVLDNHLNICSDNDGNLVYVDYVILFTPDAIEIRRVRGRLYPCDKCKFRNSLRMPSSEIHAIQQRWKAYSTGLNQGCDSAYAEIIGSCKDFKQK
jgi:hypothetical protein